MLEEPQFEHISEIEEVEVLRKSRNGSDLNYSTIATECRGAIFKINSPLYESQNSHLQLTCYFILLLPF